MGSNKFSYSCCVVTCPSCWWSSAALLIFNNGSVFRKHFVSVKGLCSWHCIISKGLLKFSMCCGGSVTEFNIKKDGIPLRDVPCFHFRDEVREHVLTRQAPTPQWITAKPCHCKWRQRKDQGQWLSVLADCSIANTARKKLVSLVYCWTSYVHVTWTEFRIKLQHNNTQ